MGTKPNIKQEQIVEIKKYLEDERYASLTIKEVAAICGVSVATVSRVRRGEYDEQPKQPVPEPATPPAHYTEIPYAELKKLIRYEMAIKELLSACVTSKISDDQLYITLNALNRTLSRCVPEEYEAQVKEALLHKQEDYGTM